MIAIEKCREERTVCLPGRSQMKMNELRQDVCPIYFAAAAMRNHFRQLMSQLWFAHSPSPLCRQGRVVARRSSGWCACVEELTGPCCRRDDPLYGRLEASWPVPYTPDSSDVHWSLNNRSLDICFPVLHIQIHSVADSDPHGSGTFAWIRIIVPDPDPATAKE